MAVAEQRRMLRVLVVDQSLEDARGVRDLFGGEADCRLTVARDAEDARDQLLDGNFDAALIEAALWSDEQTELVRYLREQRPDVAVVLLTNGENDRDTLPSLKLGAHDFVSKRNLDREQLLARILGAVEETRTLRRRDTMVRWLEREARTDHLTGLHNRRAFDDRLREVCAEARAKREFVTVIMIDVTGTRTVNEAHGYDAGDSMIRRAAAGIARCVRSFDFAARIGGDDFGIIVAECDVDLGRRIARRIAHELERLNTYEWAGDIPVAVSFGVASGRGCDANDLFAACDAQLSHNKSSRPMISEFRWREESDGPSVA
jgi:diguanylate cyclase (GGDEF)-like protein